MKKSDSWYMRDPMLEYLTEIERSENTFSLRVLRMLDRVMCHIDKGLSCGWFNMDIVAVRRKKIV